MNTESKAVFLSYASQDAESARRIAESLRAAGVEVWFDQSELRGGDAWDTKIRKQIRECALFLPVISANTQARGEGYFRREWKLAVERTNDMGDHVPFLLPLTIDGTTERDAFVPEAFLKVQWSRLPDGEVGAPVVSQVRRLLGSDVPVGPALACPPKPGEGWAPRHPETVRRAASPCDGAQRPTARRIPLEIAILAAVLVVAGAGFWLFQRTATVRTDPRPASSPASEVPRDKSIAVLPFANASADGANAAFVSDGVQEEILNRLRLIGALRVPSIDSVESYRNSTKSNVQIAIELNVAYLVKGTVRRAGETIQVTCRLIDARTGDEIVIGPIVEDQVTVAKLIATQARVAQEIAASLKTSLSPEQKAEVERRPTENIAAYESFLKAREIKRRFGAATGNATAMVPFLEEAVRLDPTYADAHMELVYAYINQAAPATAASLQQAQDALDAARRLAPNSPQLILAVGDFYLGSADFGRAIEQYQRYGASHPNDPDYLTRLAEAYQLRGREFARNALEIRQKLEDIEPGQISNLYRMVNLLNIERRYADALAVQRRIVARAPENPEARHFAAYLKFHLNGSAADEIKFWQETDVFVWPMGASWYRGWLRIQGDLAKAIEFDSTNRLDSVAETVNVAVIHAARGDKDAARTRLGDLPDRLRAQAAPGTRPNMGAWIQLGTVEAILGNSEAARRCAEQAIAVAGDSRAANLNLVRLYAWSGDKDAAIAELTQVLATGVSANATSVGSSNVHAIRRHPNFQPLQGDPRFEALLNDPKNNAPLF